MTRVAVWGRATLALAAVLVAGPGLAQPPDTGPFSRGDVTVSGSLRSRVESWNWFHGDADHDYTFLGSMLRLSLARSKPSFRWQLELAAPVLLGLPDDAIATGAQGQLGLGATYFAANDRATRAASLFVKQAFVDLTWGSAPHPGSVACGAPTPRSAPSQARRARLARSAARRTRVQNSRCEPQNRLTQTGGHQALTLGRIEVIDGTETTPADATLAALKRERIAHRLIGNFGFSHVGRSFDGARYNATGKTLNLVLFGGRPTRGVFQTDGWGELRTNIFYGALTGRVTAAKTAGDWRIFGLGFHDSRGNVLKTDNRPLVARRDDVGTISVATLGGHHLATIGTSVGTFDTLLWVAAQTGSWGRLSHRAVASAVEGGWQPRAFVTVKPWIRGGYNRGSGDEDPDDARHGTFFQVLPTPRVYARFPFFNLMNVHDRFAELIVRPAARLVIRSDVHSLRLADSRDLWYAGGGAFQPDTFGFTGRPSNGRADLATLYDVSVDYAISSHLGLAAYYGHATGHAVVSRIYPNGAHAGFGYLEMTCRF